jgi:predicted transcriptional regulator
MMLMVEGYNMGQDEILVALSKYPKKWLSAKDIAKQTNIGVSSTTMACKRLRKHDIVYWDMRKTDGGIAYFIYKHKVKK